MTKSLEALKDIKYRISEDSKAQRKLINKDLSIIEKDLKVLDIIKRHPFILERLFDEGGMHDDYNHDYWWGVVTDKEVEIVKEWLDNE